MFVAYDMKGIQSTIFGIPKLRAICGGSSLLAQFDVAAKQRAQAHGVRWIFAGGGRGAFHCDDREKQEALVKHLVKDAHSFGFDLRIGVDESLSNACHHADKLFPFNPASLDGEPCSLSGRWPAPRSAKRGIHPIIADRLQAGRTDQLGVSLLDELRDRTELPEVLRDFVCRFIRNIDPPANQAESDVDQEQTLDETLWEANDARAAANAIGGRSRWAVVCLDGNDIGKQFLAFHKNHQKLRATDAVAATKAELDWLMAMSSALSDATRGAFLDALVHVLQLWIADHGGQAPLDCAYRDLQTSPDKLTLVLPLRPLIIGGDDITLLIHPAYAMSFVRVMTKQFAQRSAALAEAHKKKPQGELWPATQGQLTMSAGVLFCKTTLPLHMAIDFAESLLKNAKSRFRDRPVAPGGPTPAAVDWESITETLVESPAERRQRELEFIDAELPCSSSPPIAGDAAAGCKVVLFSRPYALEPLPTAMDISQIDSLANELKQIPTSVRAQVLPRLRRPWSERIAFLASVAKRHALLKELLWEGGSSLGRGWKGTPADPTRTTFVPDALLLLEEEKRLQQVASIA